MKINQKQSEIQRYNLSSHDQDEVLLQQIVISYYCTSSIEEANNDIFNTKIDYFKSDKSLCSVIKEFSDSDQSALVLFIKLNDNIKFALIKEDYQTFNLFYINIGEEAQESEDFINILDEIEQVLDKFSKTLNNRENERITFNNFIEDLAEVSIRSEQDLRILLKKLSNYLDQKDDKYCIQDESKLFGSLSYVFNAEFPLNDPSNNLIKVEALDVISKLKDIYPKLFDITVGDTDRVRDWVQKVIEEHRIKINKLLQEIKEYQHKDKKEEIIKYLKKYTQFTIRVSKIFPEALTEENLQNILTIYEEITEDDLLRNRVEFTQFISKFYQQLLAVKDIDGYIKSLSHGRFLEELLAEKGKLVSESEKLYKGLHYHSEDQKNAWNQRSNLSYLYQDADIYVIQKQIFSDQVKILGTSEQLEAETRRIIEALRNGEISCCVYNIDNWHWTCFVALKKDDEVHIFYKDSIGNDNTHLRKCLEGIVAATNFHYHTGFEQTEDGKNLKGVDCGIFALENLRIMCDKLGNDVENIAQLEELFRVNNFCSLDEARKLRTGEFASQYVLGKYQGMIDDIIRLGNLKAIRDCHFVETEMVAKIIASNSNLHDVNIRALQAMESSDENNTIFVEIVTDKINRLENADYTYNYRISFSKDLANRDQKIFQEITKILQTEPISKDGKARVIVFPADVVHLVEKIDKIAVISNDRPVIKITDLLDAINESYDQAIEVINLLGDKDIYVPVAQKIIEDNKTQQRNLSNRIDAVSKEIDSLQRKREISKDKDLEDIVKLLAEKIEKEPHNLSLETINRLFEIGSKTADSKVSGFILTILGCVNNLLDIPNNSLQRKAFGKMLSHVSWNQQNIDLIIKLLDIPLCSPNCLDFLRELILNCKELDIRSSVFEHLRDRDNLPEVIKRLINLEKINIVEDSERLVELLKEMVRNHEQLPKLFIDNIKAQFLEINGITDAAKNIVKITRLLIENGDLRLSELKNLCLLLDELELCDDILDIIENGFVVEHDISKDLLDKVKEVTAGNEKARKFLERLDSYLDEDARILGNPRKALEERQTILKKFKEAGYYTQNIIKLLYNLIRYDEGLRQEAFELLQEILISQDCDARSFLIDFGYLVITKNIELFINKDKSLDYSFLGRLLITRAVHEEVTALELMSQVTNEPSGFVLAREFVKNNLSDLITSAVNVSNQDFRQAVVNIISDNKITKDEIKAQPDGKALYKTWSILIQLTKNYNRIDSFIKGLSDESQKEHHKELIKKLAKINSFQGLESYSEIFSVIDENTELMEFVETSRLILDGLKSGQAVSKKTLDIILAKLASKIDDKKLAADLISVLGILVNQSPEIIIPKGVLEEIRGYLTDPEEEIALKINIVSILLNYISDSSKMAEIPDSIHESLILILQELHQSMGSKLQEELFSIDILHKLVFDTLLQLVKLNKKVEEDLYEHYFKSYPEISKYINSEPTKELNKFQLIRSLSTNILAIGKVNTNIFEDNYVNQWSEELLLSTLVARLSRNSEINDIKLENLYENIDALKLKLASVLSSCKEIHINTDDLIQLLINTQLINNLTIEEINDIITFLNANDDTNFVDFTSGNVVLSISELREIWLGSRLQSLGIEYESNKLKQLNILLPYRTTILDSIFSTKHLHNDKICIEDLIEFFRKVSVSWYINPEVFLSNQIRLNCYDLWHDKLNKELIISLLSDRFHWYNPNSTTQELQQKQELSSEINSLDILKELRDDFKYRLSTELKGRPVSIKNEQSLRDEYKDDEIKGLMISIIQDSNSIFYTIEDLDEQIDFTNEGIKKKLEGFHHGSKVEYLKDSFKVKVKDIVSSDKTEVETIDNKKLQLLQDRLIKLRSLGWLSKSITQIISKIDQDNINNMLGSLDIIYEYRLREYEGSISYNNLLEIFDQPYQEWEKKVHELAIFVVFSGTKEKSFDELLKEITDLNLGKDIAFLKDKKLQKAYSEVNDAYNSKSQLSIKFQRELIEKTLQNFKSISNDPYIKPTIDSSEVIAKRTLDDIVDTVIKTEQDSEKSQGIRTKLIKDWETEDIKLWAKQFIQSNGFQKPADITQAEVIAVVKRAVELTSGFPPRHIQLLSLLIMLNNDDAKGRLAQINTGEGKTTIVAMLAAVKALSGHTVDIITSSSELARPQAEEQEKFFSQFGLSTSYVGKEDCYDKNIIYGSSSDFQGDILRDEFYQQGTRNGRKFDLAIVDEVDNMFIDGKNHIVMMSSTTPGMDNLETLLAAIWIQIREVTKNIKEVNGIPYLIEVEDAVAEDGQIIKDIKETLVPMINWPRDPYITENHGKKFLLELDEGGQEIYTEIRIEKDKEFLVKNVTEIDDNGHRVGEKEILVPVIRTKEDFIRNAIENHIRKLIRDYDNISDEDKEVLQKLDCEKDVSKKFPQIEIPEHLKEFVIKVQIPKWINSAIAAKYNHHENRDYIIKNGKIIPVDAYNTGVVQANMNWSDGLHQFLQIKHGTKITPENIVTNFISNVTFFQRYKTNIYGLTGTLGSHEARDLLHITYDVDSIIIPPFKSKQYLELTPVIVRSENEWYDTMVQSSINKLKNGRAVLVITKHIREVEEIKNRLIKAGYDETKIKIYKTQENSDAVKESLYPGEIIIATNISGRGTDIKPTSEVERNGGLHVCVTFMPPNARVEAQNVGRTSRTGNRGTSQFILLSTNGNNISKLKGIRDKKEKEALNKATEEIGKITLKDKIFEKFCQFVKQEYPLSQNQGVKSFEEQIKAIERKAIEEQFGLWLKIKEKELEKLLKDEENLAVEFNKFKDKQNPYFYIKIANLYLNKSKEKDSITKAIEWFDKAIEADKENHFTAAAYYGKGYAKIALYGNATQAEYDKHVPEAVEDFAKSKIIIEQYLIPSLHIIQQASSDTDLSEQVRHKMVLYNAHIGAIEDAIGIGDDGIKAKDEEENRDLVKRINLKKIEDQKSRLKAEGKSEEEINSLISGFKLDEPTSDEINSLREQDIVDSIRQKKITEKEDKLKDDADKTRKLEEFKETLEITESDIVKRKEELADHKENLRLGIINKAKSKNRGMEIEALDLAELLPEDEDKSFYNSEINELEINGFNKSFKVKEIPPINWLSVIGLAIIGFVQLVAGAALTVFTLGAGSSIGMGLMTEGVSDLITAVKDGIINRDFSWESWGIQKAISLAVSIVCAGLKAIKDAAKTVAAGIKQAIRTGVRAVTTTVKQGWKLAAKAIGTSVAKGVAKECVTQLVDYGVNQALMPSIENEIQSRVEGPIQDALLANLQVRQMLELDAKNGNSKYQAIIKNAAMQILREDIESKSALRQIAEGITLGIANNKIKGLSTILQIKEAIEAINKLGEFVPKFIKNLNKEIDKIYNEHKIKEQVSKEESKKSKTSGGKSSKSINSSKDEFDTEMVQVGSIPSEVDHDVTYVEEEVTQVKTASKPKSVEEFSVSFVPMVTASMSGIVKGKILQPAAGVVSGFVAGKLTKGIEEDFNDRLRDYQSERRIEFFQNGDKNKRIPKEFKKGLSDEEAVLKAKTIKSDLESGGEAGLIHLGAASDATGRPIHVLDEEGNLVRVIGDDKGGEPIKAQYHAPNDKNPQGHWTLPGGKDAPSSGRNNCLFDVIGAQTGKAAKDLRTATIAHLNTETLANSAHDIARLEMRKKNALQMGGALVLCDAILADDDPAHRNLLLKNLNIIRPGTHINERGEVIVGEPLSRDHPGNLIDEMVNHDTTVKIDMSHFDSSYYDPKTKLVNINPEPDRLGSSTVNSGVNAKHSFDTVLYHELNHAYRNLKGLTIYGQREIFIEIEYCKNKTMLTSMLPEEAVNVGILTQKGSKYSENLYRRFQMKNSTFSRKYKKAYYKERIDYNTPGYAKGCTTNIKDGTAMASANIYKSGDTIHKGINSISLVCSSQIFPSFYEYTMGGIGDILDLRLRTEASNTGLTNTLILPETYIFSEKNSNIHVLLFYLNLYVITLMLRRNKQAINRVSPPVILVPISLYDKHAVGVMFVAQDDGSGYKAFYLDPENTAIPEDLATIFKDNGYEIEQLPTEGQRYTNCGPEVIENFMLYLTGERLSQEEAIVNNSRLVEQELLSSHNAEEASYLTLKDSYSKEDAVTVISNTAYKTQVTSEDYVIDNPTRYDIVTPQNIIDGIVVRAEVEIKPRDVLLELVHDYRINQDYVEAILGEVTSIDIS